MSDPITTSTFVPLITPAVTAIDQALGTNLTPEAVVAIAEQGVNLLVQAIVNDHAKMKADAAQAGVEAAAKIKTVEDAAKALGLTLVTPAPTPEPTPTPAAADPKVTP